MKVLINVPPEEMNKKIKSMRIESETEVDREECVKSHQYQYEKFIMSNTYVNEH